MMPLKREPIKEYTDKQVKQMFSDEILDDLFIALAIKIKQILLKMIF